MCGFQGNFKTTIRSTQSDLRRSCQPEYIKIIMSGLLLYLDTKLFLYVSIIKMEDMFLILEPKNNTDKI